MTAFEGADGDAVGEFVGEVAPSVEDSHGPEDEVDLAIEEETPVDLDGPPDAGEVDDLPEAPDDPADVAEVGTAAGDEDVRGAGDQDEDDLGDGDEAPDGDRIVVPPTQLRLPPEPTGDARVDGALERLADLEDLPTAEHVAVFEDVHRRLQSALADLGPDA